VIFSCGLNFPKVRALPPLLFIEGSDRRRREGANESAGS
jgi:hypothetical protein